MQDKIYRRNTQSGGTPKKKKDEKARKRNTIMNFRVSPTEKSLVDKRIALSGLSKSQFFIQSCMYQARIDYISNPKRQEHLYATYQTEGVTPEFWKNLTRENQLDFKTSGTVGKCIEGREFIIALPESFVEYKADDVVRLFTDSFHKRYDVECSAALHHNKKMTNYHIHLVFSERKML